MGVTLRCRLPGCGGPESGVCINGLKFEECPDVVEVHPASEMERDPVVPAASGAVRAARDVDSGGAGSLSQVKCDAFLRSAGGLVVGIVAGPETGKTTLIATIYELLHRARMTHYAFAGSETLRGYEERCHLARIASSQSKPDTPRTQRPAGLMFTHLRVQGSSGVQNILFSDRSGEDFDEALNKPESFGDFMELRRADCILLLVDLNNLLNAMHVTKSYARRIFLAMNQTGLLAGKRLWLVGTKADLLTIGKARQAEAALDEIAQEFTNRGRGDFSIGTFVTASRAKAGSAEYGKGLEAIVDAVLQVPSLPEYSTGNGWPRKPTGLDELMLAFRGART